jgi:hypothetical protein
VIAPRYACQITPRYAARDDPAFAPLGPELRRIRRGDDVEVPVEVDLNRLDLGPRTRRALDRYNHRASMMPPAI